MLERLRPLLFLVPMSLSLSGCIFPSDFGNVPQADGNTLDVLLDVQQDALVDVTPSCTGDCPEGMLCCGSHCIDPTGTANCGECGNKCAAGQLCVAGQCKIVCTGGLVECDGECVDFMVNGNCGACGHQCAANEVCSWGACVCDTGLQNDTCQPNELCCPTLGCRDPSTSNGACGGCDTQCPVGTQCDDGQCNCGFAPCLADQQCCSGTCILATETCGCPQEPCATGMTCCNGNTCLDLVTDPANCGTCGHACGANQICAVGTCECSGDWRDCDGSGDCETQLGSLSNCKFCGNQCATGSTCDPVNGCACDGTVCNGVCLPDLQSDQNNCGSCGVVCPANSNCIDGTCVCRAFFDLCDGICQDLDFLNDDLNCGSCGTVCETGNRCCNGTCAPLNSSRCNCNNSCTDGEVCCAGSCHSKISGCAVCGSSDQCCFNASTCTFTCEASCFATDGI